MLFGMLFAKINLKAKNMNGARTHNSCLPARKKTHKPSRLSCCAARVVRKLHDCRVLAIRALLAHSGEKKSL
jgi:hypothetical protein